MELLATADRVRRLQAFLDEDPGNPALLADAWQAACDARDPLLAATYAQQVQVLDPEQGALWLQRAAHGFMDAGRFRDARQCLAQARRAGLPTLVADHDVAWIDLLEGRPAECAAAASPWLDVEGEELAALVADVQALWLRSMHRLQRIAEAWTWIEAREQGGRPLLPRAAGPASLVAIDADRFDAAQRLAQRALDNGVAEVEALVAAGCVALARSETGEAERLLMQAHLLSPEDGRIYSALGLAALQAGRLQDAEGLFGRAVAALPSHVGSWHGLGWSRLLPGRVQEAEEAFRAALALDANFAESHGALGLVLALQGDRQGAEPFLRRAHKLDVRNVTAAFAEALVSGRVTPAQFATLARRLLDRPGFFGEKLSARWTPAADAGGSAG